MAVMRFNKFAMLLMVSSLTVLSACSTNKAVENSRYDSASETSGIKKSDRIKRAGNSRYQSSDALDAECCSGDTGGKAIRRGNARYGTEDDCCDDYIYVIPDIIVESVESPEPPTAKEISRRSQYVPIPLPPAPLPVQPQKHLVFSPSPVTGQLGDLPEKPKPAPVIASPAPSVSPTPKCPAGQIPSYGGSGCVSIGVTRK